MVILHNWVFSKDFRSSQNSTKIVSENLRIILTKKLYLKSFRILNKIIILRNCDKIMN